MTASGLMFHHFYSDSHPNVQGAISAQDLTDIINYVGRENILSAEEWMSRSLVGSLGSNDLCLTFDDALRCQFDVALPVLQDMDLTAFWFVYSSVFYNNIEPLEIYRFFRTTAFDSIDLFYEFFFHKVSSIYPGNFIEMMNEFEPDIYLAEFPFYTRNDRVFRWLRDDVLGASRYHDVMQEMMDKKNFDVRGCADFLWMNNSHIKALDDGGHVVGLHSYSHPTRMSNCTIVDQKDEYQKNFDHLSGVLTRPPISMSHPCNSYTNDTLEILNNMNIKMGFRSNMETVENRTPYEFPRQDSANILENMR